MYELLYFYFQLITQYNEFNINMEFLYKIYNI